MANNVDIPNQILVMGLQKLISHPDFKAAVNSELHYTANMIFWLREIRQVSEELVAIIEEGYP